MTPRMNVIARMNRTSRMDIAEIAPDAYKAGLGIEKYAREKYARTHVDTTLLHLVIPTRMPPGS